MRWPKLVARSWVGTPSTLPSQPTGSLLPGFAAVEDVVTNSGASPGDAVVLTKPLGLGIITTAIKRGGCPPDVEQAAIELMASSNRVAGAALSGVASAATDVTGFGLLGHLLEVCDASNVGMEIEFERVPVLEGTAELLEQRMWPGGSARNWAAFSSSVESSLDEDRLKLLADAQTSGGLLVTMDPDQAEPYVDRVPGATVIGGVTSSNRLRVT